MKKYSLSKEKIKVLLLEGVHQKAVQYFQQAGYSNVIYSKSALSESELAKEIKDAHIVGIRSRTQLTNDVLTKAKKLFSIGCFCIGTNQVDLDHAKLQGIPVFNAPYSNTRSVAELVIAECVMLIRGISEKNVLAHQGIWKKSADHAYEVRNKNIGIIGYGHIGSQVSILAESMGMNVFFYDIENKLSLGKAQACNTLKELMQISNIVTLHVPATEQTKNMITKKELAYMKKGTYLLNASRGNVVDIKALVNLLKNKKLAGAAIDVFPKEPKSKQEKFMSELQGLNNVILTPHIGGSTQEAQVNIAGEVAEKLVKYSDNGSSTGAVNFVQASLPEQHGRSRYLHIHKNLPGVLKKVNYIFSKRNINIAAQYLQTDSDLGYVILDIDNHNQKTNAAILKELKKIPYTIKSRMLY